MATARVIPGRTTWARDKVAEVLSRWLGSVDYDQAAFGEAETPEAHAIEDEGSAPCHQNNYGSDRRGRKPADAEFDGWN
jgi:hypothetical protein